LRKEAIIILHLSQPYANNAGVPSRTKQSEVELVEPAINKLVRVLKRDLQKRYGFVDYEKLRKEGFSDLLLAQLQQADLKHPLPLSSRSSRRA